MMVKPLGAIAEHHASSSNVWTSSAPLGRQPADRQIMGSVVH